MSKTICFYLQLHAYGATGMADGSLTVLDGGQQGVFNLDQMRWNVKPSGETKRGSVSIVQPGSSEYPKVGFSGDFWRLIESSGLDAQFLMLCALDIETARNFKDVVEQALEQDRAEPRFYAGLVTADHTLSATILSPTKEAFAILDRARAEPEAFEINEGNEVELYFGGGPAEDIFEICLADLLERHLLKARARWVKETAQGLPEENAALKKAVRDLLAIAEGAVDHQETLDAARALLE